MRACLMNCAYEIEIWFLDGKYLTSHLRSYNFASLPTDPWTIPADRGCDQLLKYSRIMWGSHSHLFSQSCKSIWSWPRRQTWRLASRCRRCFFCGKVRKISIFVMDAIQLFFGSCLLTPYPSYSKCLTFSHFGNQKFCRMYLERGTTLHLSVDFILKEFCR